MREVYPGVFMEGIPLTGNPLKELNCFIIKGSKRNLVVDVGFDIPEGREKVMQALRELDCRPEVTDLFITHAHEDHIGAMVSLRREGCFYNTYISEQEGWFYNHLRVCGLEQHIRQMAKLEGFSDEEGEQAFLWHPASQNKDKGNQEPVSFVTVREGDVLDLGDFRFHVCMLPGHTMGLAALYEEERKLLFGGDHILGRISPNITYWQMDFDALGEYIHSLHKADALEVDHLFSAHRYLVDDMHARIRELLEHHRRRLDEIVTILREESAPRNVRQVAENMHWDYGGGDFKNFAMTQQWFATGEAFAHLEHLYWKKKICREEKDGAMLYFVK